MARKMTNEPLYTTLSVDELKMKVEESRRELFGLRLGSVTSPVKDNSLFRKLRKNIARGLTILHAKQTARQQ